MKKQRYYQNKQSKAKFQDKNKEAKLNRDFSYLPKAGDGCYVYIISASHFAMKVGVARDLRRRIDTLQSGNHVVLRFIGAYWVSNRKMAAEIERSAHDALQEHHLSGEWFYMRPKEAREAIEGYCGPRKIIHKWLTKNTISQEQAESEVAKRR